MIRLTTLLMVTSLAAAAHAGEPPSKAVETASAKMFEDAFLQMGVAYICRDAIGSAYYHSARTIAEQLIRKVGKSEAEATLMVDDFDQQIRRDHKKKAPAANQEKCMDSLMEAQTQARVSRARFEKAVEAEVSNQK